MHFEPSAERGAALDQQMRGRLAETLEYVFDKVGDPLGVDATAARQLTSRVRSHRQSPNLFGTYYELVLAIENDDLEEARRQAEELLTQPTVCGTRVAAIESRSTDEAARYRRLLGPDPDLVQQPDPPLLSRTQERINSAFQLLDRGFPEMAAEIRELLRDIVIAAGPANPKALTFDGASSYMLWGAILLNARGQKAIIDTAQALAHESGHNLLFGFCASNSLVENADEELFSSPLRTDPRPMDGIVHATYVVARMHQTVSRLLEAGVLEQSEETVALADLEMHRKNFAAGDEVIRESGRLTPLGMEVIEAARAYMVAASS